LPSRLKREAEKLDGETVSISNSSDPYPTIEAEMAVTRRCLEVLARSRCKIQIITKSDVVVRDIDLLKRAPSMVTITLTTHDDELSKVLEPNAPPSSQRLKALERLSASEIPTSVRIDPIIPYVNENVEELLRDVSALGVKHITSSTYKVRMDNWKRISQAIPEKAEKLKHYYFENGEKIARYIYLPRGLRLKLMENVARLTRKYEMTFGTCREGFTHLNTASCDGSWLLHQLINNRQR
jgi:DNA repair photolyase